MNKISLVPLHTVLKIKNFSPAHIHTMNQFKIAKIKQSKFTVIIFGENVSAQKKSLNFPHYVCVL